MKYVFFLIGTSNQTLKAQINFWQLLKILQLIVGLDHKDL